MEQIIYYIAQLFIIYLAVRWVRIERKKEYYFTADNIMISLVAGCIGWILYLAILCLMMI